MQAWRTISLWMDQLDEPLDARPSLAQDIDVDVCIIGAGYTGHRRRLHRAVDSLLPQAPSPAPAHRHP